MTNISEPTCILFSDKAQKIKKNILHYAFECKDNEDRKGFDYYLEIYHGIRPDLPDSNHKNFLTE